MTYIVNTCLSVLLTISKPALFEHLTESLAEFQIALILGALQELFHLVGTSLLLRLLLWLLLVGLLTDASKKMTKSLIYLLYI